MLYQLSYAGSGGSVAEQPAPTTLARPIVPRRMPPVAATPI